MVLCCLCAKSIEPNAVTMCSDCIRSQANITDGISKLCDLIQCPKCNKFNITRDKWVRHDFESVGLLGMCLKKVQGLENAKILDAKWVWTEPHSKRLKISVDIEKEVLQKVVVRQRVIITFVEKSRMCMECVHDNTAHNWSSCIQVRQKGMKSRKSLINLENMLVSKPAVLSKLKKIQLTPEGLDLFCKQKPFADKLTGFISSNFPVKMKSSKRLVSTASSTQHDRYEFTINVEIAPIAKGDLLVLPPELAGRAELMLVRSVSSSIHCISPVTTAMVDMGAVKYFQKPTTPLLSVDELVPFVVMDIVVVSGANSNATAATIKMKHRYGKNSASSSDPNDDTVSTIANSVAGTIAAFDTGVAPPSHKLYAVLAEAWVCKESELGVQDATTYHCFTHLGHILHAGDIVLGYDLKHSTKFSGAQTGSDDPASSAGTGRRGKAAAARAMRVKGGSSVRDSDYNDVLLNKLSYDLPDVVLVQKQTAKKSGADGSRPIGGGGGGAGRVRKKRDRRRQGGGSGGEAGSGTVVTGDHEELYDDIVDDDEDMFDDNELMEEDEEGDVEGLNLESLDLLDGEDDEGQDQGEVSQEDQRH